MDYVGSTLILNALLRVAIASSAEIHYSNISSNQSIHAKAILCFII